MVYGAAGSFGAHGGVARHTAHRAPCRAPRLNPRFFRKPFHTPICIPLQTLPTFDRFDVVHAFAGLLDNIPGDADLVKAVGIALLRDWFGH